MCGQRAGAGLVAGVLTGAHSADRLRRAGATHVIRSIAQLPGLLTAAGEPEPPPAPDLPGAGTDDPEPTVPSRPAEQGVPKLSYLPPGPGPSGR